MRAVRDALAADPARVLVAVDYDGTLAPVVADPLQAVPQPGAVEALAALPTRVAVVSGRAAQVVVELGGLARVPGLVVLGQYGVERWYDGTVTAAPPVPGLQHAREQLLDLVLEDKGHSLVLHGRQQPGLLEAQQSRLAEVARITGLELHEGRQVLELRPPGFDKGRALASLLPASAVVYCGDDLGDLPAFTAARGSGLPSLLVCSDSPECPPALRDAADLVVDGPAGVVELLQSLTSSGVKGT